MKLFKEKLFWIQSDKKISHYKDFGDWVFLNVDLVFLTDKFIEFQKDIFNEFISDLDEELSYNSDYTLKQFQTKFEEMLQDMNTKLITFADKINDVEKFDIKWTIQIFFHETYMSSMIWDVSTIIYRDNKLNYLVDNDMEWVENIDVFSEFIEWELENWDKVLSVSYKLSDIIDKNELNSFAEWEDNFNEILTSINEIVWSRTWNEYVWFSSLFKIEFDVVINQDKLKSSISDNVKYLIDLKDIVITYKYPISIVIWFLVVLYLLISLVSSFISSDGWHDVVDTPEWQVVIDFNIEDLRRDIDQFRRIPSSSDQKLEKYNEIKSKLSLLEQTWRWASNVEELKSILDEEYLRWFNIVPVNNISWDYVYTFNDDELDSIGLANWIYYSDWINISWTQWAILRAIDDENRWSVLNFDLPIEMSWCNWNLVTNWLYCFSEEWDVINITSSWIETVSTAAWDFDDNITWVGTYWSSNFYTIFNDEERFSDWVFIARYINSQWQTQFWNPQYYNVNQEFFNQNESLFASGFTNISIDWSFVTWSPSDREILQFHRSWQGLELDARTIPTRWGPDIITNKWADVDVISNEWSRYLYTLDKDNNIFTYYRSTPYKTNSSYIMDYSLEYHFSIKFPENIEIVSSYIEDWDTPILYLLTKDWVARYNLANISSWFDS